MQKIEVILDKSIYWVFYNGYEIGVLFENDDKDSVAYGQWCYTPKEWTNFQWLFANTKEDLIEKINTFLKPCISYMICKSIKLNSEIYLTSDEEIKVGDWFISSLLNTPCKLNIGTATSDKSKIIASTQNLEGVLQIPQVFVQVCLDSDEVTVQAHTFEGKQHLCILPYSVYVDYPFS